MGPCGFSQGESGGRGGAVAGISSRPTLLSLILRSGYLRRFGGGYKGDGMSAQRRSRRRWRGVLRGLEAEKRVSSLVG